MGKDAALQILAKRLTDIGLGGVVVALAVELACTGQLKPGLKMLGYGLVEQCGLRRRCGDGGHRAVPAWAGYLMILSLYPASPRAEPTTRRIIDFADATRAVGINRTSRPSQPAALADSSPCPLGVDTPGQQLPAPANCTAPTLRLMWLMWQRWQMRPGLFSSPEPSSGVLRDF
jgi:hypothetical protein